MVPCPQPSLFTLKHGINHFTGEQAGSSATREVAGLNPDPGTLKSEILPHYQMRQVYFMHVSA